MTHFRKIRVFCNDKGAFGEPHALIVDSAKTMNRTEQQTIATRLGFDETIFVNDLALGNVSFFDTTKEVPFAGTAALAAAWFINQYDDRPARSLTCGDKSISTWQEDGQTWIATKFDTMPSWNLLEYDSPDRLDSISGDELGAFEHTMIWAWENESNGHVRARTLAKDWGIPEVEANGSGSMMLAVRLGRPLRIRHGAGSLILAEPHPGNAVAIGGLVVDDGEHEG